MDAGRSRLHCGGVAFLVFLGGCNSPSTGTSPHRISGTVSGAATANITLTLAGVTAGSTLTDASGSYSFTGLANGNYTVVPSGAGYTFSPAARAVSIQGENVTGQDFVATALAPGYSLSGTLSGAAAGITVVIGGAATSATLTDASGNYRFTGLANGDYQVAPDDGHYLFAPSMRAVSIKDANVSGQDFAAYTLKQRYGPSAVTLRGVWGSGASDVWVVGDLGTFLHWNGAAWMSTSNGLSSALYGVSGSSSSDAWAVGSGGTIARWNGSAWSSPVASGTTNTLSAVWSSSSTDAWIIGAAGPVLHWNGSAWATCPTCPSVGLNESIFGVWGSASNDVWIAHQLLGVASLFHWSGSAWSEAIVPGAVAAGGAGGIWGSAANDVWAVGWGSVIAHWNGTAWSKTSPSVTTNPLNAVWGSSANDVWAVGDAGTIVHWDGSAWSSLASGTTNALYGVWGSSSKDVWAVGTDGSDGVIVHWYQ